MDYLPLFKAIHIIGFVAWFAALFYLVRLFVYHIEAGDKPQPEQDILKKQFALMERRLYKIIANPAMMITFTAGIIMLVINPAYLHEAWMHIKLTLLVLLLVYHLNCKRQIKKLEKGEPFMSSFRMRLYNEVPTFFLVAISFIAVYGKFKSLNYMYLGIGLVLLAGLIYLAARTYKARRGE